MKNVFKRALSLTLAVMTVLSMMVSVPLHVSAATYNYLFPVQNGNIAYVYGNSAAYGGWHSGIDIHSKGNDIIYAAYSGVVAATADSCWHVSCGYACEHYSTYGNYIRITQDDGTSAYYGHLLQRSLLVSVGQRVTQGQPIAVMGSSGYSTGKHLHFEVRVGGNTVNVNPVSSGGNINYLYSGYLDDEVPYADIKETTYYLKNKATGTYLDVQDMNDYDFANVGMCTFNGSVAQKFTVSSGAYGYILKPECSSSRILNAYGTAPGSGANVDIYQNVSESSQQWKFEAAPGGGYFIHNMYNPSCVLDTDGSNADITTKHGGDSQIWYLEEVEHVHNYTEYVFYHEAHPHKNCYKCSCGDIKSDPESSNYISNCIQCNTPSKPSLVGLKGEYLSPAEIKFTWTDTTHTTHNNLWVYKKQDNGEWGVCNRMDSASNNTVLTFDHGEYKAVVYAYNSNMWNEDHSDWLYTASDDYFFTVEKSHTHSYGEWITAITPTCTEKGEESRACKCGDTESREVPALGHDYSTEYTVDKEPTESEAGSKSRHCKNCTAKTDVTEIPKVTEGLPFTDVAAKDWYYDSVKYAVDNGLFNGVAADKFAPNMAMNRAMLVTVLYRMEGEPAVSGVMPFTDVKSGQYYYNAVLWASQKGVVNGATANGFAPDDNITREQMATILYRYSVFKNKDVSSVANLAKYPDAGKISSYAMDAFSWANAEGLIGGTDIGGIAHLDPKGNATRAQVATILMRYDRI